MVSLRVVVGCLCLLVVFIAQHAHGTTDGDESRSALQNIEMLRSGGGSRAMVITTLWDDKLGLSGYPHYGISGGSWGVAVRAIQQSPATVLSMWRQYLGTNPTPADLDRDYGRDRDSPGLFDQVANVLRANQPSRSQAEQMYIPPAWGGRLLRFLGSFFSRTGILSDNYWSFYNMWTGYVRGAILRPLGAGAYSPLRFTDHLQIGYADERWQDGTHTAISVIDVDSQNQWTVHHPDGTNERLTSLKWIELRHAASAAAVVTVHPPTTRVEHPIPLTLDNALVLTSAAFAGPSHQAGSRIDTRRIRGIDVKVTLGNRERTAQVWDLGNDCNIPFPFYKPLQKTFISIDASDVGTPYEMINKCMNLWRGWGWNSQQLDSASGYKATVGGKKTGLTILRLTHASHGTAYLVNIPVARIRNGQDASMALEGIPTMVPGHSVNAFYPWRMGSPEVESMAQRVDQYFQQLRALGAIPERAVAINEQAGASTPTTNQGPQTANSATHANPITSSAISKQGQAGANTNVPQFDSGVHKLPPTSASEVHKLPPSTGGAAPIVPTHTGYQKLPPHNTGAGAPTVPAHTNYGVQKLPPHTGTVAHNKPPPSYGNTGVQKVHHATGVGKIPHRQPGGKHFK